MTSSIEQKSLSKGAEKQDLSDDALLQSATDLRSDYTISNIDIF